MIKKLMKAKLDSIIELPKEVDERQYTLLAAKIAESVDEIVREYKWSVMLYKFTKDKTQK